MRYKSNALPDPFYIDDNVELYCHDSLILLPLIPDNSFDLIFADPPYFLSNGGITCQNGKQTCVNKADWDKCSSFEEKHNFNRKWIKECKRILKPHGSIWISGTFHNIYSIGVALEQEGYKILNNVTWEKLNPPPNLSCRCFTHSTETLLWARPEKSVTHYFNYALMKKLNDNKQMKDVWRGNLTPRSEKSEGKHPTQKPEYLLERIILASTEEDERILDPFIGSGTTAVVSSRLKRQCVGIDNNSEYLDITIRRLRRQNNE